MKTEPAAENADAHAQISIHGLHGAGRGLLGFGDGYEQRCPSILSAANSSRCSTHRKHRLALDCSGSKTNKDPAEQAHPPFRGAWPTVTRHRGHTQLDWFDDDDGEYVDVNLGFSTYSNPSSCISDSSRANNSSIWSILPICCVLWSCVGGWIRFRHSRK